jgi:hypothetical protein
MNFSRLDLTVFVLYFLVVGVVAVLASRREKLAADYFLAGRNLPWWLIGISLIASNISTEQLVGQAGQGADFGLAVAIMLIFRQLVQSGEGGSAGSLAFSAIFEVIESNPAALLGIAVAASLLLLLAEEHDSLEVVGLTHQDLAETVGTYRETATQVLNDLKAQGLIEIGRKRITILDPERLLAVAES